MAAGLQFDVLFTSDLYLRIARNAVEQAAKIKQALLSKGYQPHAVSPTNQQFFVIDNATLARLQQQVCYSYIAPADADHSLVRFCTSWATTDEQVEALLQQF